jgi:polyisoprenoid-binding protein YceI
VARHPGQIRSREKRKGIGSERQRLDAVIHMLYWCLRKFLFSIDAASFAAGHPWRDKDVKSANFLHVQEHPHITFESSHLVREGDGCFLRAQLTVRGHSAGGPGRDRIPRHR